MVAAIGKGEMICAVGYSESEAGTDLANLRTRAVRDGQEWVINGSKIWNSGRSAPLTNGSVCARSDSPAIAEFR